MTVVVASATVDDPGMIDLLATHLATMRGNTPAEFVFALDTDALRAPNITLFGVRDGEELIGCGALATIDDRHAELKSMHVRAERRGEGLAGRLVEAIEAHARHQGVERLSLETGATEEFAAARALYQRHGYRPCGPFGSYRENPHSAFFAKRLDGPDPT